MTALTHIRNIGIIAHIDAGKTTLTERMLFYTRKIHRMGEVHEGTATMDYLPEEQERGITITSACTTCQWGEHTVNIIDTPGHVDFTIEVSRALRVLDGAVGVFCAVGGVEPQSETVWRQSEHYGVPKIAFINKIDRIGADYAAALRSLRERLGIVPVPLVVPLGTGETFTALLDCIRQERVDFDPADQGQTLSRRAFTPEEAAIAAPWREQALEILAEADERFLEAYLTNTYSVEDIFQALRHATLARAVTPVLCGSALRNVGVQLLLDAVRALLPSPIDVLPPLAQDAQGQHCPLLPDTSAPLVALVFKVLMETGRKLAFLRIYAGTLREGATCRNVARKTDDRISRIYRMHADRREPCEAAVAGDIVAVVGLRSAHTGDTYADSARPWLLESIDAYAPVMTLALEPRNADEGKTLDEALTRFVTEDPTLTVVIDQGSGHRMVSGMGELHLEVLQERIQREYGIAPRAGHPQIVSRETICKTASATAEFDRDLGKESHYGKVTLTVAPLPRGAGNSVVFDDFLPQDPKEAAKHGWNPAWVTAVEHGIHDALQCGVLTGYPVQDVAVTITCMERREGVSSAPGFHMAAGAAVREALTHGNAVTLEPIMTVEISVPEAHLGAVLGLLSACMGRVENMKDRAGQKTIHGRAPLNKLFGFSTALRSATQGRAGLALSFSHFDTP